MLIEHAAKDLKNECTVVERHHRRKFKCKKEAFSSGKEKAGAFRPIEQSLLLNQMREGGECICSSRLIGEAVHRHLDRYFPVGSEPGSQPLDFGKLIIKEVAAGK